MSQRNKIAIFFTSNFSLVILKTNDFTMCGLSFFINTKYQIEYQIQQSLGGMALILLRKVFSMILTRTYKKKTGLNKYNFYLQTNKKGKCST